MRSEVHAAALRAAAKVAFSAAFISGCNAQSESVAICNQATDCTDAAQVGSSPSLVVEQGVITDAAQAPAERPDASVTADAGLCEELVDAAFPTESEYPGEKQSVSAEVQACCVELLLAAVPLRLEHHWWDCCANLTEDQTASIGIACTPWGPPVPPAMRAVRGPLASLGVA